MASSDPELKSPDPKYRKTDLSESDLSSENEQEWESCKEDIYVQQHFKTNADEFIDTIFNLSLQHFTSLVPSLKKSLTQLAMIGKSDADTQVVETKINEGLANFIENFYSMLELNSDKLLLYLRKNIINISENTVLPNDEIQLQYKKLVRTLQAQKIVSMDDESTDYTEENTAELLTQKAAELRKKLQEKSLEKVKLEHQLKEADGVINRLNNLESTVNSVLSEIPGDSLQDFVLRNVAAAIDLPVICGQIVNGTK